MRLHKFLAILSLSLVLTNCLASAAFEQVEKLPDPIEDVVFIVLAVYAPVVFVN